MPSKIVDGHVEFPVGSGCLFPCDGTLGQHPQWWQINDGRGLDPGIPVVLDKRAPLGYMYIAGDMAFVQRAAMKVDEVLVIDMKSNPFAWVEAPKSTTVSRFGEYFREAHSHVTVCSLGPAPKKAFGGNSIGAPIVDELPQCSCPHGPYTTDGTCQIHVTPGIHGSGFVGCECDKCLHKDSYQPEFTPSEAVEMLSKRGPVENWEQPVGPFVCYLCDGLASEYVSKVPLCRRCRE